MESRVRLIVIISLSVFCWFGPTVGVAPPAVECYGVGNTDCKAYSYQGLFSDRNECRAAKVVYPTTEQEVIAAVADGVKNGLKMRVISKGSHSLPSLVCPGGNGAGMFISTRDYKGIAVNTGPGTPTATVEAGVMLKAFMDEASRHGLTFPHMPYWGGLSISGILGTGAHGSGIWGKGSSMYEYVKEIRLVVPASEEDGYAKVINLVAGVDDEILNAARLSLGVLGVISTVTLELQPMFKRSFSLVEKSDVDLETQVALNAEQNEFGDITWYPAQKLAVYRLDNRVPVVTTGEGVNKYIHLQPLPAALFEAARLSEEVDETSGDGQAKCMRATAQVSALNLMGHGFTNNGTHFTGYPVVGFQNSIATSGTCEDTTIPSLMCVWDRRHKGVLSFEEGFTVSFSNIPAFIRDVKALVALNPESLCGIGLYAGILMRHIKKSRSAYLGPIEDGVELDIVYYRSRDPHVPRLYQDVTEEIEQMLLFKYNARPHWGKSQVVGFVTTKDMYPELPRFLKVKNQLDPQGLFSNDWTDSVLNVDGAAANLQKFGPHCALDGQCICTEDIHCAPEKGYFCQAGRIYTEARVCRKVSNVNETSFAYLTHDADSCVDPWCSLSIL
ncbi:hypothetical protein R1sor_022347 [Riccia sorocarpa]|uniref:L-gulonolactone oxidase n=1 Tax=Riccia sorocarpa TaxID=122646 RepID=A0ABD3GNE4_9MARC